MVAPNSVLDALKQIGLNLYERKLWVALLSRGTATAGELSSLAKVPHSRTYDVLESLAEKGFAIIQASKPLKYAAIAPAEAFERAKKKIREDSDICIERLTDMQGSPVLKELEKIFKHGVTLVEPNEITGTLRGRGAMHNQLESVIKGAKSNISILTTASGFVELNDKHGDLLRKAAGRGVKVRIAAPTNKDHAHIISALQRFADVKRLPDKDMSGRFALVDGQHVIMALTDDKETHSSQDLSLWTQSPHVAAAVLGPMFETMWAKLPAA
jgi:sugar-specific transcriptional regulator TrmB